MRVLLIITAVYAVKPKRSPEEIADMQRQQRCAHQETRWLFVRGLHHSGTTLMRTLLAAHKDVGEVKTPGPGGEGQHAQDVFPIVSKRGNECDDTYRCGSFVGPEMSREKLCGAWLRYATNKDAPILLEKTPDLMVPFLGRYWGEIASLAVVVRHPLMWHYLRPIRWHNHQFHCRNEGRPFLRPQRCAALWLGLHTQLLQDVTNNAWTGSWALLRYEGLSHSALTDAAEILNVNSSRFITEPTIDESRVWATNTTWGASPFASGACTTVASTVLQHFGYDLAQPKKSRVNLVMYDVDHDDATAAAIALTEFVASSSFTECLRHGGRGDAAHGALVAAEPISSASSASPPAPGAKGDLDLNKVVRRMSRDGFTKHRNAHGSYYVKPGDSQRYRSRVEVARRFYPELFGGKAVAAPPAPPAPRPVSDNALFGGGRLCLDRCAGKQGPCAFCGAGACCRKNDPNAPVACARGVLGCLDDACCVGPFGIGLPDDAAATALVAAKKAWDAGGDADAFARAKVKVLAGGA
jgi:hypothetical protein